ncbi:basic 7S globulin-like [Chenopodium quinoa]|uniref:basic 7S globulin-like n=1 Tax=Chenopodium quinoa TaxID=63459 RepID=UPI000B771AFF|nr:basic 7S globulin-like [Chenopodium quinoa]
MASFFNHYLIPLYLLFTYFTTTTISAASAIVSPRPKSLLLTISKDTSTSQYTTKILQRTPPVFVPLTLDLGTQYLWLNCGRRYVSSTYKPVPCGSPLCALANAKICRSCPSGPKPGCNNNTCRAIISNPITNTSTKKGSELATDVIKLNSSNGATTGDLVSIPNFLFVCAPTSLLGGLAKGVSGVAGFGRTKVSFPTQASSAFRLAQTFALCLPPFSENGFAFLGDGPYNITPGGTGLNVDLRSMLTYTPLVTNPVRTSEYFIGVQGIRVGGEDVSINKSLLSIDSKGYGGTTISLIQPYTSMESSIYKAVTTAFDRQILNTSFPTKRVAPVAPFKYCYDTLPSTRVGPSVSNIDLVLQGKNAVWTIAPLNSLVSTNVGYCIAFVDGGKNPKSSIVIGGYQIEDNLVQFDRAKNRIGISSSLVYDRIRCSFFNFTTTV